MSEFVAFPQGVREFAEGAILSHVMEWDRQVSHFPIRNHPKLAKMGMLGNPLRKDMAGPRLRRHRIRHRMTTFPIFVDGSVGIIVAVTHRSAQPHLNLASAAPQAKKYLITLAPAKNWRYGAYRAQTRAPTPVGTRTSPT